LEIDKQAAKEKAAAVITKLRDMKLKEAAKKVEDGILETLTYMDFPHAHWTKLRSNNVIERLNREIRRRTRVVGTFPDGNSALMLVCARLHDVPGFCRSKCFSITPGSSIFGFFFCAEHHKSLIVI